MKIKTIAIHLGLFLLTFMTTTVAGMEWAKGLNFIMTPQKEFWQWENIRLGLIYSSALLGVLTVHEFGHYFFAKHYKANVTLPYYIPMWFAGLGLSIGTMGAFIKIKSPFQTRSQFFDVGVAGPLAGFVIALGILIYGFTHLPEKEYIYEIHPNYKEVFDKEGFGSETIYSTAYLQQQHIKQFKQNHPNEEVPTPPETFEMFGIDNNLLMIILSHWLVDDLSKLPHKYELMHYPLLFAGYLACFLTALNLIPIGQLDGGHALYGLIGAKKMNKVSPFIFLTFIFYGGLGIISPYIFEHGFTQYDLIYIIMLFFIFDKIYSDLKSKIFYIFIILSTQFIFVFIFPNAIGYTGYLVFGLLLGRFLGISHPRSLVEKEMNLTRKVIGVITFIIFILCFTPYPFVE